MWERQGGTREAGEEAEPGWASPGKKRLSKKRVRYCGVKINKQQGHPPCQVRKLTQPKMLKAGSFAQQLR